MNQQNITIRNKLFGKSSEKRKYNKSNKKIEKKKRKYAEKRVLLPSERYPDARIIERDVEFTDSCQCQLCNEVLVDSGMVEVTEFLTVVPKEFIIIRQKRHKYRCEVCHGDIQTAPAPPRIIPGSVMSDELLIDVTMSKYCDLIPIERYATMAGRGGLEGLPPQTLIGGTHQLGEFVKPAYERCKDELFSKEMWQGDETGHNMLEGSDISKWYLWGFSSETVCYFDIRDTRSGDVATELLLNSGCRFFMSDVFSGYVKSIRETNKLRLAKGLAEIVNGYCNAHSRRKFDESEPNYPTESDYFIAKYKVIYQLNKEAKGQLPEKILEIRSKMKPLFEEMQKKAEVWLPQYAAGLTITKALSYFLNNYEGLTRFTDYWQLPIDNNFQESLFRSPVVGRKTWLGTHSIKGAKTSAIHFTLVECCKINKVNPREYYKKLVRALQNGEKAFTPYEYLKKINTV